jgi:hypothetical protein
MEQHQPSSAVDQAIDCLAFLLKSADDQKGGLQNSESRRPGGLYTSQQRHALEEYYDSLHPGTPRDSQKKLRELSISTGLSKDQIHMWLRNRRARGAYKGRAVHNVRQVRVLEWLFLNYSQYPSSQLKRRMSDYLMMSYAQLQKWFQTRRQRGAPALLSHQSINEEEWERTLQDVHQIIEEATTDEYHNLDRVLPKKRKLDSTPIKGSHDTTSPSLTSSEFSPNRMPFHERSEAPLARLSSGDIRPPQCPTRPQGECRLPSLRQILEELVSLDESQRIARPPQVTPYIPPFATPRPLPPQNRPHSEVERPAVLPPLRLMLAQNLPNSFSGFSENSAYQ